jgi:hypothetical protein
MKTNHNQLRTVLFAVTVLVLGSLARASGVQVIDFEDLYPGDETSFIQIPDGYMGFNWSYDFRGVTSKYRPGTGYDYGTIGRMSAYTSNHRDISMTSTDLTTFNFVGVYITAAWLDNEPFTVEGWRGGICLYTENLQTSTNGPYWFDFNFRDIDTLWFKPINESGDHHIVIDNITITPEPATLLLLGFGAVITRTLRRFALGPKRASQNETRGLRKR